MIGYFRNVVRTYGRRGAAVSDAALGSRGQRARIDVQESSDVVSTLLVAKAVLQRPIVVMVPISRLRDGIGRSFGSNHPFLRALSEDADGLEPASLSEYYSRCICRTATEVLDLSEAVAPGLRGLPAAAFVMPWHRIDPIAIAERRDRLIRDAGRRHGIELSIADGQNLFGPVSEQKLRLEYKRLTMLRRSMAKLGYRRGDGWDGDISGELLVDSDGCWCIRIRWGLHRAAVAAHLGRDDLPIRFENPPVVGTSAALWPQVRAGRLKVDGALAVLDRFIKGEAPMACCYR
jgi:hypothetical protein